MPTSDVAVRAIFRTTSRGASSGCAAVAACGACHQRAAIEVPLQVAYPDADALVGMALVMASPGAATFTQDPLLLNEARCLLASLAATASRPYTLSAAGCSLAGVARAQIAGGGHDHRCDTVGAAKLVVVVARV